MKEGRKLSRSLTPQGRPDYQVRPVGRIAVGGRRKVGMGERRKPQCSYILVPNHNLSDANSAQIWITTETLRAFNGRARGKVSYAGTDVAALLGVHVGTLRRALSGLDGLGGKGVSAAGKFQAAVRSKKRA